MEKEKLVIRNFGPIKNVELELGRINILIGENATGKSTVAKVLAVCRYFSFLVDANFGIHEEFVGSFKNGLIIWGLNDYFKHDTYINYDCKHYQFSIQEEIDTASIAVNEDHTTYDNFNTIKPTLVPKSQEFKLLLSYLEKLTPKINGEPLDFAFGGWIVPNEFYKNYVSKVMDNPFYFPTERGLQSLFSLGQSSIPNISNFLFNYFVKVDSIVKQKEFKSPNYIEPLKIMYYNSEGQGLVRKYNETEYYKLDTAASGYQSTIPIVLLFKHYHEIRKKSKTFIIEEPELNLFPTAQNELMRYLVSQTNKYNSTLLATTHSPYILTSLNNMMYAYQKGKYNEIEVSNIINKDYWLNPHEVSCYRLLSDGTTIDIIDNELKLIDAGQIDEISRYLNEDYDKLSDIKINN